MSQILAELSAFIQRERNYFETHDNNRFAMGFGDVLRYRQFLNVVVERHTICNNEFVRVMKEHETRFAPGSTRMTPGQSEWVNEWSRLSTLVQLEIETYFLLAKVLLDKVARFIEFYFGPARKLSLDSHDLLTKNFESYAAARGLQDTDQLRACLEPLKRDIADFRDYQIAHQKSPRITRGLLFSGTGEVSMVASNIYPKANEAQVQSRSIDLLEADLQIFLRETMTFLSSNRARTNLERINGAGVKI
jgi:hypothetical protein